MVLIVFSVGLSLFADSLEVPLSIINNLDTRLHQNNFLFSQLETIFDSSTSTKIKGSFLVYAEQEGYLVKNNGEIITQHPYNGFAFNKSCFDPAEENVCPQFTGPTLSDLLSIPNNPEKTNVLLYPKYNIEVPIVYSICEDFYVNCIETPENEVNTDTLDSSLQQKLENGIVHIYHTPQPGEVGNSYIVGHSSNFLSVKSPYNEIFKPLERATQNGEEFIIYDQHGRELRFNVFDNLEIWKNEAELAYYPEKSNPELEGKRIVTLQTSILVNGVPSKRWLTRGELVLE